VRLLLDTHVWLWSLTDPSRLSRRAQRGIARSAQQLWLSPISVWEILMLVERGRLKLDDDPRRWVRQALELSPVKEAPLGHEAAIRSREIPLLHEDPADRMIVATALVHELTLVTADETLLDAKPCPLLSAR